MIPWELVDKTPVPAAGTGLQLFRRGADFSIRVDGRELMSSRTHGSEETLAEAALARIATRPKPRVLVAGLGMGYTLAAALKHLPRGGQITLVELVPAVAEWNRGPLADLAGRPLEDPRVSVVIDDLFTVMTTRKKSFDAILMDVDNGPRGLTREGNGRLYSRNGLTVAAEALRPEGVLAVWSAGPDLAFTDRMKAVGFDPEVVRFPARASGKGGMHTLWIAPFKGTPVPVVPRRAGPTGGRLSSLASRPKRRKD